MSEQHKRVKNVFRGIMPDRVPLCEQVIASSIASELLGYPAYTGSSMLRYQEVCAWMQGEQAHAEFVDKVFDDVIAVHRLLDLDILFVPSIGMPKPARQLNEYDFILGDIKSENWQRWHLDIDSQQFGVVEEGRPPPVYEEVVQIMRDTVADSSIPPDYEMRILLKRALCDCQDEFVIGGDSFMSIPMQAGWLEAAFLEQELTADYFDVVVERNIAAMRAQREHGIWLFNGGGDFASNTGPIYSPALFNSLMAPRWKKMCDWCRQHDASYIFRSDGNLWPVAASLFGWAQPHAYYEIDHDAGMHLDKLRASFPELVLIGNLSCDLLRRGTPAEVRDRTLACIEQAAPRCIIASANALLHGTPVENILTMYDTARNWRPGGSEALDHH